MNKRLENRSFSWFSFNLRENQLIPATIINLLITCLMEMFVSSKDIIIPVPVVFAMFTITQMFVFYSAYTNCDIFITLATITIYTIGMYIQFLLIADSNETDLKATFEETSLATFLGLAAVVFILFLAKPLSKMKPFVLKIFLVLILIATITITVILLLLPAQKGTHSWFSLGSHQFQLTELHKPLFALFFALLFNSSLSKKWLWSCIYIIITTLCLAVCAELGTALILFLSWIAINTLLIDNKKILFGIISGVTGIGCVGVGTLAIAHSVHKRLSETKQAVPELVSFMSAQFAKISVRFKDFATTPESNSQPAIAHKAIIRGGWLGSDEVIHIPVERYDYTFAALLLRMGIIFGIIIILLFALILWRTVKNYEKTASKPDHTFVNTMALIGGIIIFTSAMVSIGGNIRLIPLTGVVLPFIASGESSGMINWFLVGLVLYSTQRKPLSFNLNNKVKDTATNIKVELTR